MIETYTYLYINFETDVISYVRVGSAPTIKSFSASISSQENIRCSGYSVKCIPFITKEILDSFGSRAEVGSISITTKKPTTKITEYLGGIREDDIEELDSTEMTLQLSIKPKSRGGNTTSGKGLGKIFNKFKNADENLSKFVVNIADEFDEKKTVIDLMNYKFIRSSDISTTDTLTTDQYKREIVKVYERELMTLRKLFKI